jgi:diaminopimelate epimerase
MHGLGNDFMVIESVTQLVDFDADRVRAWADRRTGVGFDQLLLIEPPATPEVDFLYRIFNADGSEVEQCGNGARCAAWYIAHRQLSPKPDLVLQTNGGPIATRIVAPDAVEVKFAEPRTDVAAIPFCPDAGASAVDQPATYEIVVDGTAWRLTTVNMGNPHGVLFVDSVATAPVETLGATLVGHPVFPEGANIGFCEVVDPGFLRLRVYERGVGETRACGTGACAAVVAAQLLGRAGPRVKVSLPGGKVRIAWQGSGQAVKMTGPATLVYEGRLQL